MFPSTSPAVFAVVVHPLSAVKSERHHALLMISTMKPDVLVGGSLFCARPRLRRPSEGLQGTPGLNSHRAENTSRTGHSSHNVFCRRMSCNDHTNSAAVQFISSNRIYGRKHPGSNRDSRQTFRSTYIWQIVHRSHCLPWFSSFTLPRRPRRNSRLRRIM